MTTTRDLGPRLTVITDEQLTPARIEAVVAAACIASAIVVQLRARTWSARDLLACAERLRRVTSERGCRLVVHERVDVALAVDADGVHLAAAGIAPTRVRSLLDARAKRRVALGVSIHSADELRALVGVADSVHFGPVFQTPSKDRFGPPQGLDALRRAVDAASEFGAPLRVVAVGGITAENAGGALEAGADGVAVIRAVMGAADPALAVRAFSSVLERWRT